MGIFDAMNTSVGGLQAQPYAFEHISGAAANSYAAGCYRIRGSFEDLVPDASIASKRMDGVLAYAQATSATEGKVLSPAVATNTAITRDDFFSVERGWGTIGNEELVFNDIDWCSQRSDFQVDADGKFGSDSGCYLLRASVDPKAINLSGKGPAAPQLQNSFIPAQATTASQYAAKRPTNATGIHVFEGSTGQTLTCARGCSVSTPAGSGIPTGNFGISGQSFRLVAVNVKSSATGGQVTINTLTQTGYAVGKLNPVDGNKNCLISSICFNGEKLDLAQVPLSHVNGANYVKQGIPSRTDWARRSTMLRAPFAAGGSRNLAPASRRNHEADHDEDLSGQKRRYDIGSAA